MVSYYKTVANRLIEIDSIINGCWVSVVDPTAQERKMLIEEYGLDSDFLKSSLDEEESSRVEQEEKQTLIIVDTAVSEVQKDDTLISTPCRWELSSRNTMCSPFPCGRIR